MECSYLLLTGQSPFEPLVRRLLYDHLPLPMVHTVSNAEAATIWLEKNRVPALAVILPMAEDQMLHALEGFRNWDSSMQVVVLSKSEDLGIARQVIHLGAADYVPVTRLEEDFGDIVKSILTKGYVGSYTKELLVKQYTQPLAGAESQEALRAVSLLTRQQRQVLQVRIQYPKDTNDQLADKMGKSLSTFEKHTSQIINKLGLAGQKGLTAWIHQYGPFVPMPVIMAKA